MKMPCFGEKAKDILCKIMLLDETQLNVELKSNCKAHELLRKVFDHLNLVEKDYFNLRYLDSSNQTHWLDALKTLGSQLKDGSQHTLYFCVKFYAADPCKLHEEITRYQMYMQVKRDILQGRLPVPFDLLAELCAYAVQSELGDYDSKRHCLGYVSELCFVANQSEELEHRIMQLHRTLTGHVPASVEYKYLDKVKWLDMYGVDLHPVQGEANVDYFVGLTPTGIVVYRNKNKVGNYFWPRITKVTFKAKMFMLRVRDKNSDENTYAFECMTKSACKHLWRCCVEHHAFFRLMQSDAVSQTGKLFSLGSKHRYSGRTEGQVIREGSQRVPPQVVRVPSKRQQRRLESQQESNNKELEEIDPELAAEVSRPIAFEPRSPGDSPRSTRSAPWETTNRRGMFSTGSPLSVRSEKIMFPNQCRNQSGSESESANHCHHHHRKHRHHHRSRDRGSCHESDGESEASSRRPSSHHHHHHHRRRRQMPPDFRPGSIASMNGSESSHSRQHRRRRSKSPGGRAPEELAQHFKYVEQAPDKDYHDMAYTTVNTDAEPVMVKYSPNSQQRRQRKHRHRNGETGSVRSSRSTKSQGNVIPYEEPPPPYEEPHPNSSFMQKSQPASGLNQYGSKYNSNTQTTSGNLKSPTPIFKNSSQAAPIVKTRPSSAYGVVGLSAEKVSLYEDKENAEPIDMSMKSIGNYQPNTNSQLQTCL